MKITVKITRKVTPLLSMLDHMADVIGARSGGIIAALTWDSTAQSTTTVIGMKNTTVIGAEIGITTITTIATITTIMITTRISQAAYRH
jgi:hypothetical protein